LIQMVDLTGTYGLSFLIVLGNIIVYLALKALVQGQRAQKTVGASLLAAWIGLLAGIWLYGVKRVQAVDLLAAAAPRPRLAVVQGNIDQNHKWDPAFQQATIAAYERLSRQAAASGAELVVWPETAAPFFYGHQTEPTRRVEQAIADIGVDVILGSPSVGLRGEEPVFFNSAFLVDHRGVVRGKYDKVHLVPFGEYVPLKRFLPFLGKMVEQVGDFSRGPAGHTLSWHDYGLGVLICYEIIFPTLSRSMVQNQAGILINMTNDAWFGRSSAPQQHLAMAVMRAVENRRSLARSANTGISGFIDPTGRIVLASNLFEEAALTWAAPVLSVKSVYTRWGDWLAWLCLVVAAVAVVASRKKGNLHQT
jgi:apolipoprotein N-acyltransferase